LKTFWIPSSLETLAGQLFGQFKSGTIMIIETGSMCATRDRIPSFDS
jgi:hypothetical protein